MKLKLVVVSMSLLGLVSSPSFSAVNNSYDNHYSKTTHGKMARSSSEYVDYKDSSSLPVKPAPVDAVCTMSEHSLILDEMTQNVGRALPNPCNPGWFDRLSISGGINVDFGKWGNRNTNYMGENYQRLSLNDVYLNIAANVNDWAHAFASISYNTATINDPTTAQPNSHVGEYDAAYSNNVTSGASNALQLEQGFITLANFDASPVFVQIGKQYQDFSRYEIHPITESLTQVMSKVLATSAKAGFIANGFNGSVYVFDTPLTRVGHGSQKTNYGASLGVDMPNEQLGWSFGVAYLHNLIGANDVAYNVNQFTLANSALNNTGGYSRRVPAAALYADVNSGPFYVGARYTTSLRRFNVNDLPRDGIADIDPISGAPIPGAEGARPWAFGLTAGYGFTYWCDKSQNIYAGFQSSGQAAGLNIPRKRLLAAYDIEIWKNTDLMAELDHDIGYNSRHGGTGRVTNLISLRAAVKFA